PARRARPRPHPSPRRDGHPHRLRARASAPSPLFLPAVAARGPVVADPHRRERRRPRVLARPRRADDARGRPRLRGLPRRDVALRLRQEHRQRHARRHPRLGHDGGDLRAPRRSDRDRLARVPAPPRGPTRPARGPARSALRARARTRTGRRPRAPRRPGPGRHWLAGSHSLPPQRRSVILEVTTRLIFHTMLMFSLFLLFSGHNAPGGGFSGGIVAGIALAVRYLAGGRYELGEAAPVHPGILLGSGMRLAATAGIAPMLFGQSILQSFMVGFHLPIFGEVHIVSTLVFDIGVYLVVVGLVLDILRTLGAEVDRQGEASGQVPP